MKRSQRKKKNYELEKGGQRGGKENLGGGGGGEGKKQNRLLKVMVCEKKNYEPRTLFLGLGWVSSHPKNPKTRFFEWCTGGCWVTQAQQP